MDKELEKIILKLACEGCITSCKVYRKLIGNCEEGRIFKTISQLKLLFKKKAKECIRYKVMDIGRFDDEGNLIEKYQKPKEIIITDSEVCEDMLKNIDQKFK